MIRRALFWIHLGLGLAAAAAILVMSVTGVVLAFERQALHIIDRELRSVTPPPATPSRPLGEMLATAAASAGARPATVVVRPDPAASVEFTIGRDRSVFVDPFSGAVLGESSTAARRFFAAVERWHRTLGEPLGARGPLHAAGAASNLLFLLLVLSGPFLWLPRVWSWPAVRSALFFRRGVSGRARDWNWHNVVGIWCAVPLVLITLTGVVMSYPWANEALFRLAGSVPPARPEGGRGGPGGGDGGRTAGAASLDVVADLDRAVAVASVENPGWRTLTLRVPSGDDRNVGVTVDTGAGGEVEKRRDVVVDTVTGRIVRRREFADGSLGQKLRSLARFVHTGEEGGVAGQVVAAVASLGGVFLVWTGVSLAYRRLRGRLTRTASARANAAQGPSDAPPAAHAGAR